MKLYSRPLSGHAHRVRLFLSLLGIEHSLIEVDLADHDWIVAGPHPTLADVALYSYFAQAPEGNVDLAGYPRVNRWLVRIEALPGFVPFQKTPAGLAAIA